MAHTELVDSGDAHDGAAAFADFDHDGLSANADATRAQLFRNETDLGPRRTLEVRVVVTPGTGAAGGLGARERGSVNFG